MRAVLAHHMKMKFSVSRTDHAVRSELGRHVGIRADDVTVSEGSVQLRMDAERQSAAGDDARRGACAERLLPQQNKLQQRGVSAAQEVSNEACLLRKR